MTYREHVGRASAPVGGYSFAGERNVVGHTLLLYQLVFYRISWKPKQWVGKHHVCVLGQELSCAHVTELRNIVSNFFLILRVSGQVNIHILACIIESRIIKSYYSKIEY